MIKQLLFTVVDIVHGGFVVAVGNQSVTDSNRNHLNAVLFSYDENLSPQCSVGISLGWCFINPNQKRIFDYDFQF